MSVYTVVKVERCKAPTKERKKTGLRQREPQTERDECRGEEGGTLTNQHTGRLERDQSTPRHRPRQRRGKI